MTEILTESFCERCGTRYTFESVAPRQRRLGGIRVLSRGLKNFVLSDDASLDESMAAARSDADREASAHQLDAFHKTFSFCMSCRQYTCSNCWNAADARCLSCAPLAVPDVLQIPIAELDPERLLRFVAAPAPDAWPTAAAQPDPSLDAAGGWPAGEVAEADAAAEEVAEAEAVAEAAPVLAVEAEAEAAEVEAIAVEAIEIGEAKALTPDPQQATAAILELDGTESALANETDLADGVGVAEVQQVAEVAAPVAAETATPDTDARGVLEFEPGVSLDDAIAAYEASVVTAGPALGPGIDIVDQPTWPEPIAEPGAAVAEPDVPVAEPGAAVAEPDVPVAEPAAAAVAQPDEPVVGTPAPAAPAAAAPQWPVGPRWPTAIPAGRQATPPPAPPVDALAAIMARQASDAMWAASSEDLARAPLLPQAQPVAAVQPCVNCGISLSGSARFCRRCGTPQAA